MSLLSFHRLLIATSIVLCGGFAWWEFNDAMSGGGTSAFVVGTIFVVFTIGLVVYLRHLAHFLGYDQP